MSAKRFQVAISFAGEQRSYAEDIARFLSQYGIAYFYDAENEVQLWGKNLSEEFHKIYSDESQFVLMLISKNYIDKQWCLHERRSAIDEGRRRSSEFILPVRFDEAWPDGLHTGMHHIDGTKKTPAEIAAMIAKKLGLSLYAGKASALPPPQSAAWLGDAAFDYERFNGRYVIGVDEYAFETAWSSAGQGSIHVYNHGANINGIAIAYGISDFGGLANASLLDFTSRHRGAANGNIVVYRNSNGIYAALKILSISVRRGEVPPELRFWYVINRDGSADFSRYKIFC